MSDKQLRDKKAELTTQREGSKDQAAKTKLLAEIMAIDKEFQHRVLDAGRHAAIDFDRPIPGDNDAVSALGRTIDRMKRGR